MTLDISSQLATARMVLDDLERSAKFADQHGRQVKIAVYTEMLEEVDHGHHDLEKIATRLADALDQLHDNARRESLAPVPGAHFSDEKDLGDEK